MKLTQTVTTLFDQPRFLFGWIAALCGGFLSYAFYLQHYQQVYPCPLCVLQRYVFFSLALVSLLGLVMNAPAIAAGLGFMFSVGGGLTALYQLWVIAHPTVSCGRDSLEQAVNSLFPAKMLPGMFKAEGLCNDLYEPILGLTTPQWSLVWFSIFLFLFLLILLVSRKIKKKKNAVKAVSACGGGLLN